MSVNIVIVSPFLLGDSVDSGGAASALGFLKSFASRHKLHVIAFDQGKNPDESARAVRDMRQWAASVRVVPLAVTVSKKLTAKLLELCFFPSIVVFHSSALFREACREILAKYPIDLAVIQFPQMAQYVDQFPGIPTFMDVQDAYSVSAFRGYAAADSLSLWRRFRSGRGWLSWIRYERRYYKKFTHLFVVSEQDGYGLRLFNSGLKVTVLPRMISLSVSSCVSENPPFHIGFIGSFSHRPNILAINFLFERILPSLTERLPGVRVLIAGKNPPQELLDRAPNSVTFAGFVPSVEDFYRQTSVVVAPMITGGGVKIKVIEGLLSGVPVVTTSIGAEGIGLTDGVDVLIADAPDDFIAAILKLTSDAAYRMSVGTAGQKHAQSLGSIEQHSRLVDQAFESGRARS